MGIWRRMGRSLLIRAFSGKNSSLTEVPFWNCPEEIFYFMGRALIEDCFSHSECISCYRIAKYTCECAEIRQRRLAAGDDSKNSPWRGSCGRGFLVFVTFQPRTFQGPLFRSCHFLLRKWKRSLFPTLTTDWNGAGTGPNSALMHALNPGPQKNRLE
jgi:hypothetical protein